MMKMKLWTAALCLLATTAMAQPGQISLQSFATGFNEPLFLTHAGDERMFVVEKDGKIIILNQQGQKNPTPFLDIDLRVNSVASERGLLGLAFHPKYKENGYFYVNYTNSSGSSVVSRFSVSSNPDIADPNSEVILLTVAQPYSNHNGGCINFGPDGYLYLGFGDGGSGGDPGNRGQNLGELLGKMLRIDVDNGSPYGIPPSNPYYGSTAAQEEIWAVGVRNPWRFSFDKVTGDLWIGDVGQDAQEEVDFWPATATTFPNFGWRCYEGNLAYNTNGCQSQGNYDAPAITYNQTNGNCSMTGGYVYRGARFASMWDYYFHADYCAGYLWWSNPNGSGGWNTTRSQSPMGGSFNLASFGEDWYGELYLTGIGTGIVYHLVDSTCTPYAYIPGGDTLYACQPGGEIRAFGGPTLSYQWQLNGSDVPGATTANVSPATAGDYRVIVRNGSCVDTSNVVYVALIPAPVVDASLLDTLFCDDEAAVSVDLQPAGGTLSGPGVSGVFFDPAVAGSGTHMLHYHYTDPQTGCSGHDSLEVTVTTCVSRSEPLVSQLRLSPNPTSGMIRLQFMMREAADYAVEVYDLQGKRLKALGFAAGSGIVDRLFDLQDLATGSYLLTVKTSEGRAATQFAIQR